MSPPTHKALKRGVSLRNLLWLPLPSPQVRNPLGKAHIPTGSRLKQQSPHSKKVNRTNEGEFLPFTTSPSQGFSLPDGDQHGKLRAALQVYYDQRLGSKAPKDAPRGPRLKPSPLRVGKGWGAPSNPMSTHSSANTDPEELLCQKKGKKDPHSSCGLPGSSIMLLQNRYKSPQN